MLYTNALIIFFHIMLTYTVFIFAYSNEQLDFILKYVGTKLIIESEDDMKHKPALVKEIILKKFPSNALSVV